MASCCILSLYARRAAQGCYQAGGSLPFGYDRPAVRKFLIFSLPVLILTMALFRSLLAALGRAPELTRTAGAALPAWVLVGTWALEALGLSALFLLIQGGGGNRMLNGLLTGWIAWVFRGPLLVVAVVTLGGLPAGPWWAMALSWWFLYTLCGLLLGAVGAAAAYPPPASEAPRPRQTAAPPL
jgi:hypothetical protein